MSVVIFARKIYVTKQRVNAEYCSTKVLTKTSFRIQINDLVFITNARDINIMVKAKPKAFAAQISRPRPRTVSSKTFQGPLLTHYFVIYVGLKYSLQVAPCHNMLSKDHFTQLFKTHRDMSLL